MARQWFAIAAIGRDRPGIVADLSECVYSCSCNLEDASMTMLGNEFATLMLVSGIGDDVAGKLSDATRRLEWERHLTVFVRPLDGKPERSIPTDAVELCATVEGIDKAGIVAGVTRCLADHGVHITDLRGVVTPTPQAGTPLYTLRIRMALPPQVAPAALSEELAGVADKLGVDLTIDPPS